MAHIDLGPSEPQTPGIRGLMAYRPQTGRAISALAQTILRGDSPLSAGERELIASYVSNLNGCNFCYHSHAAVTSELLDDGGAVMDAVLADVDTAPVREPLRGLLRIAAAVAQSGTAVTPELVAAAREAGATDLEIHDAVLVAAAFSMMNRYVDGLGTWSPTEPEAYAAGGKVLAEHGYAGLVPQR